MADICSRAFRASPQIPLRGQNLQTHLPSSASLARGRLSNRSRQIGKRNGSISRCFPFGHNYTLVYTAYLRRRAEVLLRPRPRRETRTSTKHRKALNRRGSKSRWVTWTGPFRLGGCSVAFRTAPLARIKDTWFGKAPPRPRAGATMMRAIPRKTKPRAR